MYVDGKRFEIVTQQSVICSVYKVKLSSLCCCFITILEHQSRSEDGNWLWVPTHLVPTDKATISKAMKFQVDYTRLQK